MKNKKNKRFKVPVYIRSEASHYIGDVEVESDDPEEYKEKANILWESQKWDSPNTNCHNDFDLGIGIL